MLEKSAKTIHNPTSAAFVQPSTRKYHVDISVTVNTCQKSTVQSNSTKTTPVKP